MAISRRNPACEVRSSNCSWPARKRGRPSSSWTSMSAPAGTALRHRRIKRLPRLQSEASRESSENQLAFRGRNWTVRISQAYFEPYVSPISISQWRQTEDPPRQKTLKRWGATCRPNSRKPPSGRTCNGRDAMDDGSLIFKYASGYGLLGVPYCRHFTE